MSKVFQVATPTYSHNKYKGNPLHISAVRHMTFSLFFGHSNYSSFSVAGLGFVLVLLLTKIQF